jgi:hypothetical protein
MHFIQYRKHTIVYELLLALHLVTSYRVELTKLSQLKKGPEGESPMVRVDELAEEQVNCRFCLCLRV